MTDEEIKEILRYMELVNYMIDDYILQDEYEELQDLIKKNRHIQIIDDARYKVALDIISEEEYNRIQKYYDFKINEYFTKTLRP